MKSQHHLQGEQETEFSYKLIHSSAGSHCDSDKSDSIGSVFTCTMAYAEGTLTAGGR
ncbi:hypothetical protein L798_02136 [Zootermopsis nevadensis]|uniref:Uncharacterized protein n=1 Tax=Zootermopsis nevadensis TaxID=136037 RepID=A0A067RGT0_ZOONE|nr:hypothetical protein L798_02136 [Zootermopsis nevadensis]